MSRSASADYVADLPDPICDFCGCTIDDETKDCPARDEGKWRP